MRLGQQAYVLVNSDPTRLNSVSQFGFLAALFRWRVVARLNSNRGDSSGVGFLSPMVDIETPNLERLYFGKNNLVSFPPSNLSFKILPDYVVDRQQRCLIDNLWVSHNKKDTSHFVATLNCACFYFNEKNLDKRFKFYVVFHGKTKGIFQTWLEVVDSIKDVKTPLFKGFNVFTEALDYARGILGPNYYITPALRHNPTQTPQYNIQKDSDKINFCDHCTTMTESFKRLNHTKEILQIQNSHLLEKVTELELKLRQSSIRQQTQSSPSP
ncbi:hypothetical protein RND71_012855 [Anisodus tanguticus]|uniref:Ribonuclease H1 N-terminal domain-containing protein n=1 Tax=Anisodus tanguticus TaxID=243964 RepID=A0AAE1SGP4_9SOLA|nr:hypothetical protein RND71_012855 [Anisodus tanguticus]